MPVELVQLQAAVPRLLGQLAQSKDVVSHLVHPGLHRLPLWAAPPDAAAPLAMQKSLLPLLLLLLQVGGYGTAVTAVYRPEALGAKPPVEDKPHGFAEQGRVGVPRILGQRRSQAGHARLQPLRLPSHGLLVCPLLWGGERRRAEIEQDPV